MRGQEKSLERKNGSLRGVEVQHYIKDEDDWKDTNAVGWTVVGGFFIGVGELPIGGYEAEITLSKGALRRMLARLEG